MNIIGTLPHLLYKIFRPISVKEYIEFKEAFGLDLETEVITDAQDSED